MIDPTISEESIAESNSSRADGARLCDLLPFTIGDQTFAVLTDQIDATVEARPVARLPRTPAAVAGVVCVRGRMLTVLDAAVILRGYESQWGQTLPFVIVLRGDEQLGLVAERCRETVTISPEDIEPPRLDDNSDPPVTVGTVTHGGETVIILDPSRLFRSAVQRRERRRRRF